MSFSVILKKNLSDLDGPLKKKLQELFPRNLTYKLIYRASDHGFGVVDFHTKCDNIPNTLTLVESSGDSNVFGGFVKVEWDSVYSGYKSDTKAFIFSLRNKDQIPLVMECQQTDYATFNDNSLGPVFGAGSFYFFIGNLNSRWEIDFVCCKKDGIMGLF
jgi:hypothetical protein